MGAAATPPSPASAHAAPKTRVRTRATLAPRQSAISLFWATARIEQGPQRDRSLEIRGRVEALRGRPVEDAQSLLENEGEPECQQELVDRRATVDEAQRGRLEKRAEGTDDGRHDDERRPEPAGEHDGGVPEVGAQHVEDAVREVDDAQDAEDQGEAGGDEEEQPRERQRVEELLPQIRHA